MKVSCKLMLWYLIGLVKHSQSYQNIKFVMSLQYLQKLVRNEVDFLHEDKHQSFLQVYFNTWLSKFPTSWYYIYWWVRPSILKVLKLTSLQYLYNISKIKLGKEFIFALDKHQNFYKLALFWWNRNLEIFLQYLKQKVSQLLFLSIVMQNVQMF